jgi:hypothetical protein
VFHLAQVNIAHARAPLTDPVMADFVGALDRINARAEAAPGVVWRYQDESGSATETHAFDSSLIIVNLSVWDCVETLRNFTYRSDHLGPLQRRREALLSYDASWKQFLPIQIDGPSPLDVEGMTRRVEEVLERALRRL